jgi:hypothetical protein
MEYPMNHERIAQLRAHPARLYGQARECLAHMPTNVRIILGLFLLAAVLMAAHAALSTKDASLHLKLQHDFRSADLSVWIDGDLAYSGKLKGALKRKFGLLPESVQGSLSQIVPVSSGTHQVRLRIVSEDGSAQEDNITGDFARNTERELSVSARRSALSLGWQATNTAGPSSSPGWFTHYASTLFLTIAGSIISALTGFALRELPAHIRARQTDAPKAQSTTAGQ